MYIYYIKNISKSVCYDKTHHANFCSSPPFEAMKMTVKWWKWAVKYLLLYFCRLKKGTAPKIHMLCFVVINSVLFLTFYVFGSCFTFRMLAVIFGSLFFFLFFFTSILHWFLSQLTVLWSYKLLVVHLSVTVWKVPEEMWLERIK